jgi:ABC-type branched-subunit amino acid transport system ATPase component
MRPDHALRPPAALKVDNLCKAFGGNRVLKELSFELPKESVTALIGSNGAGKSTALNIISGLIPRDSGRVFLHGKSIEHLPAFKRSRRGMARTFQQPRSFRTMTSLEAVCLAQASAREESLVRSLISSSCFWRPLRRGEEANRAMVHLEECRLADRCDTIAADLTYGEQKLLMLAQALAFEGGFYCFDELCAGLQPTLVDHVAVLIQKLSDKGNTVLFVEHNLELVRRIADRTIFLHEGRVFSEGPTKDVLSNPAVVQLYLGD